MSFSVRLDPQLGQTAASAWLMTSTSPVYWQSWH
jgi:hypothetical protein